MKIKKGLLREALVRTAITIATATLLLGTTVAVYAAYPDRPIGVMVAYNFGGTTDFQARIATMASAKEKKGKALSVGQPIYITNRAGAGGRKGWNWFANKAPADGYMLAAYNVPHFIAQSIIFDTKYNIDNLEPVGNWGADPVVLIVGKDSEFNTAEELVAYAKKNPGNVTVSGSGKFVSHHIAHLQFAKVADIKLKYVSGKGTAGAMQLVKKGQVKAGFNNLSDVVLTLADVKVLAIVDLERHALLPDIPTLMELGIPVDDSSVNYRGLMVPKGTPADIISYLEKTVPVMFKDKKTLAKMKQINSPVRIMTRTEVIAMWKKRQAALSELLKDLK